MVYTGDVDATKERIISKVKVRRLVDLRMKNVGKPFISPGSTSNSL